MVTGPTVDEHLAGRTPTETTVRLQPSTGAGAPLTVAFTKVRIVAGELIQKVTRRVVEHGVPPSIGHPAVRLVRREPGAVIIQRLSPSRALAGRGACSS